MAERTPHPNERKLDLDSLKALAHPLRVQILDVLSVHGAFTASGLGERLGESSGSTSYHLRQLERHGFVREVEGKGSGRERWWERVPGGIALSPREVTDTPAGREAVTLVMRMWENNRAAQLADFIERGFEEFDTDLIECSNLATANIRATPEQLKALTHSWDAWATENLEPLRGRNDPGSRPVQVHFNAFPIVGGAVTPDAKETEQ